MHVPRQPSQDQGNPTPRRARFHIGRFLLIFLLVLVFILSACVIFYRTLLRAYAPELLSTVATQYRDLYDIGFEYDGYRISGISNFTISGVTLTDLASGLELVKCDAMHVRSSFAALATRGADPMKAVTSVVLDHPVISLGRKNGQWDTGRLFAPSTRPKTQFPGKLGVRIRNGEIKWLGGEVSADVSAPPLQIGGLQGDYVADVDGGMGVQLAGTLVGSQVEPGKVAVKGVYNAKTLVFEMTSAIDGLDLKLVAPYLEGIGLEKVTGLADTKISLLVGPGVGKNGYSLLGNASIRDGSLHYDYFNIDATGVTGEMQFSHMSLFTPQITGLVEGSSFTLRGRAGDFGNMHYDMVADGRGISQSLARKILPSLKLLPVDGPVNAHIEFSGAPGNWDVTVQADSPEMASGGVPFQLNDLLAWYSDDKVTIRRAEAGLASGKLVADGVVDLTGANAAYKFHAVGTGIASDRLQSAVPASIRALLPLGTISTDVNVASTNGAPVSFTGRVDVPSATIPAFPSLPPMSISFPFSGKGGNIEFKGASAAGSGVSILADGAYSTSGKATAKIAVTLDDPRIVTEMTNLPLSGKLALAGDVVYTGRDGVSFNGDGIINDVHAGAVSSGRLAAKVAYKEGVLHLSGFDGLLAGARVNGNLVLPLAGGASSASGNFSLSDLDIGPFLPGPYASAVSTALVLKGTLAFKEIGSGGEGFEVDALIAEPGARIGSNLVSTVGDGVSVKVGLTADWLGVSSIAIDGAVKSRPAGAPIYAGRVLTPYGERVIADITRILMGQSKSPESSQTVVLPSVSGTFNLSAGIMDPLGKTRGNIDITSENLTVEGYEITSGAIRLSSAEGDRWSVDLTASSDSAGSFEISGDVDRGRTLMDSTLALSAAIHDSGLNQLFQLLGLTEFGQFTGSMNGSGAIGGTLGSPVVSDFKLDLSHSDAFGIPLNQGTATFGYQPPVLNLVGLDLEGTNGFRALGAGSIDLTSPSLVNASLVLRLDKFNLDYVRKILGARFPFGGIASGTVQLARDALGTKVLYGATVSQATAYLGGNPFVFGDVSLDAMTRLGSTDIELNSLKLTREGQEVDVHGTLPLALLSGGSLSLAGLSSFAGLDLAVSSDTGYTPSVPGGIVASGISWDGGLGPVHLTLKGADLEGDFALDVGNVRLGQITLLNGIKGPLHVSNSVITASPDELKLLGQGWELGVSGQTNLLTMCTTCPGSARFAVVSNDQSPLTLSGKGYSVQLDLGTDSDSPALVATGPWQNLSATVTGLLNVKGGSIDIAQIPPLPLGSPPAKPGPLTFNLKMNLKGGLTVKRGDTFSFDFDRGSLDLTGPATDPVLSGSLTAPGGWMDIMGNHFVLTDPLVMDFSSLYRFDPHVTAAAQCTLREVRSPANFGQEVVVTAKIDGRMSKMLDNMQLSSQPSLTQDELLAALAYEDVVFRTLGGSIFGDSFGAPGIQDLNLEGIALPLASSYLSKYIRRRAGLSDFEISMDQQKRTYIYVEKQVLDTLVAYYRQTFGPDTNAYLFGIRYRWRPRSWVSLEIDGHENVTGQVQYIIPLK